MLAGFTPTRLSWPNLSEMSARCTALNVNSEARERLDALGAVVRSLLQPQPLRTNIWQRVFPNRNLHDQGLSYTCARCDFGMGGRK
jgi:hypothetical protein